MPTGGIVIIEPGQIFVSDPLRGLGPCRRLLRPDSIEFRLRVSDPFRGLRLCRLMTGRMRTCGSSCFRPLTGIGIVPRPAVLDADSRYRHQVSDPSRGLSLADIFDPCFAGDVFGSPTPYGDWGYAGVRSSRGC